MQKPQIISSYVVHTFRILYQVLIKKLLKFILVINPYRTNVENRVSS